MSSGKRNTKERYIALYNMETYVYVRTLVLVYINLKNERTITFYGTITNGMKTIWLIKDLWNWFLFYSGWLCLCVSVSVCFFFSQFFCCCCCCWRNMEKVWQMKTHCGSGSWTHEKYRMLKEVWHIGLWALRFAGFNIGSAFFHARERESKK